MCAKREQNLPTSPPGLLCRSCSPHHLRSSSKQETDVLEITTFLPASDSLFGPRLIFKQSYLTWSDYILNFNEMATEKPRNSLCEQLTMRRRRSTIPLCILLLCERLNGPQSFFMTQQHGGKRMLC